MRSSFLAKTNSTLLIAAISFALYALIDFVFGLATRPRPYDPRDEPHYDSRISSPSYVNEPYFSEPFLIESILQPGGWLTPDHTRLVLPQEFHGRWFNVDSLKETGLTYRRTVNVYPRGADVTKVLLIGGSTTYNSEVPDEYTVASVLSSVLNDSHTGKYHVINAGVTSVNSAQELERLNRELTARPVPRIVIVYDGVNDIAQGIYFNNPDGVMFSAQKRSTDKSRVKEILGPVIRFVPRNIYHWLQARAYKNNLRIRPEHMKDAQAVLSLASRTKQKYLDNITAMKDLASRHGFSLYVMLQPNVFVARYVEEAQDIHLAIALAEQLTPGLREAVQSGYPLLREAVHELRAEGVFAYDLSEILRDKTENVYLDFCHVNSVGNKIIANAMAKILLMDANPVRAVQSSS